MSGRFSRSKRLSGRKSFEHVFRRGKSCQAGWLCLYVLPNGSRNFRLGIVVGRKGAGTAVRRNRVKRWLREAFRQNLKEIPPGLDIIVRAKRAPDDLNYQEVNNKVECLLTNFSPQEPGP